MFVSDGITNPVDYELPSATICVIIIIPALCLVKVLFVFHLHYVVWLTEPNPVEAGKTPYHTVQMTKLLIYLLNPVKECQWLLTVAEFISVSVCVELNSASSHA
jgi:hypothetical protein